MQRALLCTDAERWSFHVCIRKKVVISFAFVRTATSIPAVSPPAVRMRPSQAQTSLKITKCLRHSPTSCTQQRTAPVSGEGAARAGITALGSTLEASQKSGISLTQHKWMVISVLQGRYLWLYFASFSLRLFSVSEQSLQWENLLCERARPFNIWIVEKIVLEAVRFQICHGSCMGHTS